MTAKLCRLLATKTLLTVCLLLFTTVSFASSVTLTKIKAEQLATATQLLFDFSAPVKFRIFTLRYPNRLVMDINNTKREPKLAIPQLNNSILRKIRFGKQPKGLRIVLDAKQKFYFTEKAYPLAGKHNLYRLQLLLADNLAAIKSPSDKTNQDADDVAVPAKPIVQIPKVAKLRDVIVVIDPGHGGKDPGASGPRGTHEKNVVLAISRYLRSYINASPGMRAVLTRKRDYYISLRKRLEIARRYKGDIFVAVHADAFKNPKSHGASVFALSQRGATSEAARWLAERENTSELGGVSLSDKSYQLRSVLLDLSQTATIGASLELGQYVLTRLGRMAKLHNRKVEQARFVVLKSPDIPSILIETGFISNPYEEKRLRSAAYQKKLARAIYHGIKSYFWHHPPMGSLLAAQRHSRTYKVARGDSLSKVAALYGVSIKALKSFNELQSNALRVGQVLRIPHKQRG